MTKRPHSRPPSPPARAAARSRPPASRGAWWRAWLATLVLVASVFALYGNTVGHDYSADDPMFTLQNRFVQHGLAGLPDIFAQGSMVGFDDTVIGPYRPMLLLSFMLEIALWGNNPHAHHGFNVLLYALLAVLLYRLLRQMLGEQPPLPALLIALLFVCHPVHTEVVASIKSRDEILAWLFGILGFSQLLVHSRTSSRGALALSTLCFLLALLSKENSVTFVLVAPLLLYFFTRDSARKIAAAVSPWLVALVVYLAVRIAIQGALMSGEQLVSYNNALVTARSASDRLATSFVMLGKYILLLVFPRDLTWDYSYNQIPIVGWSHWTALLSVTLYGAMVVTALVLFKRRSVFSFGILFYFITLSVVSNVFFLMASTMGERFLFVPSFGFCLVLGVLLWRWLGPERSPGATLSAAPLYGVLAVILLLYGGRTVLRNRDWKDSYSLFSAGVRVSAHSARAHGAMGTQFATRGEAEPDSANRIRYQRLALAEYRTMVSINPEDAEGWFGVGGMQMALGNSTAALDMFRETLKRRPRYARALNNAGVIFFRAGNVDSAAHYFARTVEVDSAFAEALGNLGATFLVRGDPRAAVRYFDRALLIDPFRRSVLENRRKAYLLLGDTARANASGLPAPGDWERRIGAGLPARGRLE
jgi:hypothetical protein